MRAAASRRRRWPWLLAPLLAIGALLALSDGLYRRAAAQAPAFSFPDCRKVWAHRGHAASGGDNSLRSVQAAFERGAAGVEIDILFDRALDDFVVSHDRPYTLYDGQPLRLASVLSAHAAAGFFWLDAKDLRKLPPLAAHRATRRLAALIESHGLKEKVFVESSHALYLSWLADRSVRTSLTVSPNDRKYSAPVYRLHAAITKLAYVYAGATAISMDAARYTPLTAAAFRGAPVLLSTVNDADTLRRLSALLEVKVVLSDDDHYALGVMANGCTAEAAS